MKISKLSALKSEATSHASIDRIAKKVIIRKGEIPHLTQFAQGEFKVGSVAPKHKHDDMYEIFLVEKGVITFIVNNQKYILTSGETIIIEPGDYHEVQNNSSENVVMTYFSIIK